MEKNSENIAKNQRKIAGKKYLRVLVNFILITLISLFLAELALRLYNHINPNYIFYSDSYNRFRGKPFAKDYNFRLNSKGFKDLEFKKDKANAYRIIGLGDSFAYGVVPYEFNYLTILENHLNQKDKPVEVLNMGIPGIGPEDYLALLVNEGLTLDPDLVIVSFFVGNDFQEGSEQSEKRKLYTYSYVASLIKYIFTIRPIFKDQIDDQEPVYNDNGPIFDYNSFLIMETSRSLIYMKKSREVFSKWLDDSLNHLKQINNICKENNIKLLVLIIPDEAQINPTLQSDIIKFVSADNEWDFYHPSKILANRLLALNISHLDLYEDFLNGSKKKRLYKPNDSHWNIAGNALAAELLRDYIIQNYLENKN